MSERYNSFPSYCKKTFGKKLYKIPLDAGFTCPNRDGTCGTGGCIFCDEGGSGDFAYPYHGQKLDLSKIPYIVHVSDPTKSYIGYFQAYSNTYGPKEKLYSLYDACLSDQNIAGISIATRPDCMQDDVVDVLVSLKNKYPDKFIWVEFGLQTIHEQTAKWMRRGYPLEVFQQAVEKLQMHKIDVIVHVIIGLYHETKQDILETIHYLNQMKIQGIKLHLLHILKGSDLADFYESVDYPILTEDEYVEIICECIANLDPSIVIHRLTGDGDPDLLIAPKWSLHKRHVLNQIGHMLKKNNIRQGCALSQN